VDVLPRLRIALVFADGDQGLDVVAGTDIGVDVFLNLP
jgi:hypothetical protein